MVVGQGRLRGRLFAAAAATAAATRVVGCAGLRKAADLVPQDAANGADRRHVVLVADAVGQQAVPDLPGEDPRVALLVVSDVLDHVGGGDAGFAPADGAGQDGARLVVAG